MAGAEEVPKVKINRGTVHNVDKLLDVPPMEVPRVQIIRRGEHLKVDTSKTQPGIPAGETIRPAETRGTNRVEHPRSADEFNQLSPIVEEIGDFSFQDYYNSQTERFSKDPQRKAAFQTDFMCNMLAVLVDLQIHAELRTGKGLPEVVDIALNSPDTKKPVKFGVEI